MAADPILSGRPLASRSWWMQQLHLWHWLTGGASLSILLFFAATGFLLNHPGVIRANASTEQMSVPLPAALLPVMAGAPTTGSGVLPADLARWLTRVAGEPMQTRLADYSDSEIWIDLPRPGGGGSVLLDRATGDATLEITRQGWLALAADLHKGRETGPAWGLVIDLLALGSVAFALTGLALLALHAKARPATWPVTAGGFALPLILFLLFVHV
ncbi:PepSY-associated TM helix domain-containing protein [Phaeovulum sp. W22_SRMD_FR3]|uniref:PepSY-associated TM helix domain-containing protein n=1 Tax=Phaeovulum sp. W22_SRMD_FR3 TaxID=3240274 RepID=UPI003F9CC71A